MSLLRLHHSNDSHKSEWDGLVWHPPIENQFGPPKRDSSAPQSEGRRRDVSTCTLGDRPADNVSQYGLICRVARTLPSHI